MRISDWSSDVCSSDLSWTEGDSGHWQSTAPRETAHLPRSRYARGRLHALRTSPFPMLSSAFPDGFVAAANRQWYRSCASCAFVPEPGPAPCPAPYMGPWLAALSLLMPRSEAQPSKLQSLL